MYHYVYRITNIIENKHYYGCRSTNNLPKNDLGIKYFSSSKNKDFIKDQKEHPTYYKYKIIYITKSRKKAIKLEIRLHNKFDVGINESFYNNAKQTATGFDTTGKISINGIMISLDEFYTGNYKYHTKNKVIVKDKNDQVYFIDKNDQRYLNNELISIHKGFVNAINENGIYERVTIEEYYKRNLTCNNTGKTPIIDENNNRKLVASNHPNIKNGLWKHCSTNLVTAYNLETNEIIKVHINEFKTNEKLCGINKNKINDANNPNAKHIQIYNNNDILMFDCIGNFKEICRTNNLPFNQLRKSYSNGGGKIYSNKRNLKYAEKNGMITYIGWYAKKI